LRPIAELPMRLSLTHEYHSDRSGYDCRAFLASFRRRSHAQKDRLGGGHGIDPSEGGGRIDVVVRRAAASRRICLSVSDTGGGIDESKAPGIGLANLRERLAAVYGVYLDADGGAAAWCACRH